jgi:hypothetical protein
MRRLAALACAVALAASGCSYAEREPGLFPIRVPTTSEAPPPRAKFLPKPTNPRLPVAGEAIWVSGGRLPVTFRFAVHAVRRIEGAAVLDWSVTPLRARGFEFGDDLPGIDLGLTRDSRSDVNIALLDPSSDQVFQPLSHTSRQLFNHCLCTPPWVIQQDLRIGETRLMQIAYPELPATMTYVDVSLATLAPFIHVPVSPIGMAPTARQPTNLARSAERRAAVTTPIEFRYADEAMRRQSIQIDRVVAAPGRTAVQWTLRSVTDQNTSQFRPFGPPVSSPPPEDVYVLNTSPASGPLISLVTPRGRERWPTLWVVTEIFGQPAYECLCTELGLWSSGLRVAGGAAQLTGNYPALPPGTGEVDIVLPGFGSFRKVPVVAAPDSAASVLRVEVAETGLWSYRVEDPPRGWSTADWPTDLPDPAQLSEYRSAVERVGPLPTG